MPLSSRADRRSLHPTRNGREDTCLICSCPLTTFPVEDIELLFTEKYSTLYDKIVEILEYKPTPVFFQSVCYKETLLGSLKVLQQVDEAIERSRRMPIISRFRCIQLDMSVENILLCATSTSLA
ncbi:hypothetical protein KC355_g69 [Hortaea werneckii]|nr:hypothetical protein KC355_g69 [Hortaea werneckii]